MTLKSLQWSSIIVPGAGGFWDGCDMFGSFQACARPLCYTFMGKALLGTALNALDGIDASQGPAQAACQLLSCQSVHAIAGAKGYFLVWEQMTDMPKV